MKLCTSYQVLCWHTVNNLPGVEAGAYAALCIDANDLALNGTPQGGTFTGIGVTNNTFDPSQGTQTLTYHYTDGNGCTNSEQSLYQLKFSDLRAGVYLVEVQSVRKAVVLRVVVM